MAACTAVIKLPFVRLGIRVDHGVLSRIKFLPDTEPLVKPSGIFLNQVVDALQAYAKDPDTRFNLPLGIQGTEFQRRVWSALTEIRPGYPVTYSALADELGTGARAVGNACRHNPFPLVVPCHRVVAKRDIGGFAGDRQAGWTSVKQWLLAHEAKRLSKDRRLPDTHIPGQLSGVLCRA